MRKSINISKHTDLSDLKLLNPFTLQFNNIKLKTAYNNLTDLSSLIHF